MKEKAVDLRPGWIIQYEGRQFAVLSTRTVKSGTGGGAFIQTEMRNIQTGSKAQTAFRSTDSIERLSTEELECTFLYKEGENYVFMNMEDYSQITVTPDTIGDDVVFLSDGINVRLKLVDGSVLAVEFPTTIVCTVVETDPQIKGATATAMDKPAILDIGIRVVVPSFVNLGEKIVLKTATREYSERYKEAK
ncbi:MAG: elongation factor P [Neisseriales bacterium]|jgi:elongation factor P|nr:MAG: elongation factor P [Neisseriales bacterium]HRG61701.1 elongation factor P [Burkholderiales bacterium]